MAQLLLIVSAELLGLFLLSRRLTQQLFRTVLLIVRHRSIAISVITALLFPGTVIHELSHLFTAEILGVKTGKLTLAPESINGKDIQAGSVEFVQTDPFRRTAIGLAPFFVGLIALFGLSSALPSLWNQTVAAFQTNILFSSSPSYLLLLTSYLLFCISNTMFTSPEDMKGVIPLAITLLLLGGVGYIAGIRIELTGLVAETITTGLTAVSQSISIVLLFNLVLYVLTSAILWIAKGK